MATRGRNKNRTKERKARQRTERLAQAKKAGGLRRFRPAAPISPLIVGAGMHYAAGMAAMSLINDIMARRSAPFVVIDRPYGAEKDKD